MMMIMMTMIMIMMMCNIKFMRRISYFEVKITIYAYLYFDYTQ